MSTSPYFVSESVVRNLKKIASRQIPNVPSSHLSEGVAAALGFNTHAALRAALAASATVQARNPSNATLALRLRQLGHLNVPNEPRVLPDLGKSYTPFRTYPVKSKRGIRWRGWRNLLVSTINSGLEQRVFGLSPGEDWWPGGSSDRYGGQRGIFRFTFDREIPAVATVGAIGGDELAFHVVLNPKHGDVEPDQYMGFAEGDAFARCWLERRLGVWIQDGGEDFSCRRTLLPRVADVALEPNGYADQGSFIL
jgi:hypothetical protein